MAERTKPYYSVRMGKNPLTDRFDLATLRGMFCGLFVELEKKCYFQESFGYQCVDEGYVPGTQRHDLAGVLLLDLRKTDLTPFREKIGNYTEEDLFDMTEFLHEHCSKPNTGKYHEYCGCGWHYSTFQREIGQAEYREQVNKILALYECGYELSKEGEILALAEDGLGTLLEAPLPSSADPESIAGRVAAATLKFRRYRSSEEERRDAVRDLADVLEYLRTELKTVFDKQDEADLFNLANNFGIRHHNSKQKTQYDKPIWYSWMFYYYLATIHAATRLLEKAEIKQ